MTKAKYGYPPGGLPPQTQLLSGRAIFTTAYAVIPGAVMTDIVTSLLPHWTRARFWIVAKPLSGFAETFSQYICELEPGGGSERPEPDPDAEAVLFVADGEMSLRIEGLAHDLTAGGYAYLPPRAKWSVLNTGKGPLRFHWVRKSFERVEGLDAPEAFVADENDIEMTETPGARGKWWTTRFVDPGDVRHDMQVNIVTLEPGAVIPFMETHVMEHGLYVLSGKAVYRLNDDWVEVEAGDFLWLRAFCPQACYAGGPDRFRYLLYKNVNRHMPLKL